MEFFQKNKQAKFLATVFGGAAFSFLTYFLFKKMYLKYKAKLPVPDNCFLKKEEAFFRSSLIENLSYSLYLNLTTRNPLKGFSLGYHGQVIIKFGLSKLDDIFIDFSGKVKRLVANGKDIIDIKHSQGRIYLDKSLLKLSNNEVLVIFDNHFSTTSRGLKHWRDIGNESICDYIFTNLEPCFSHHVFPCFDQPDLKAKIKLFTSNQKEWEVISNSRLNSKKETIIDIENQINVLNDTYKFRIKDIPHEYALFEFAETELIPLYSFLLCAGNFICIEEKITEEIVKKGNCSKMRIYIRDSLKDDIDEFDIFHKSRSFIDWYCQTLGIKMPFSKMDHVFIPEIESDVSEHAGAITYHDKFVKKNLNQLEYEQFNSLIGHGLAHMWFGNYVTPKWWDELWIKESISVLLSTMCMSDLAEKNKNSSDKKDLDLIRFKKIWDLFSNLKSRAYIMDQFETTHPIQIDCLDTHCAESLYDQFLHYKGSAILKYFHSLIGNDNFIKGLRNYLIQHGNKNAGFLELKNVFLEILKDNKEYSNAITILEPYIFKEGMNELSIAISYEGDLIKKAIITQNNLHNPHNHGYYHYVFDILLIYNGESIIIPKVKFESQKSIDISSYILGRKKPEAIVLNPEDTAYFSQIYDEESANWLFKNFEKIESSSTMLVVARDLFDNVRHAKLDPIRFIEMTCVICQKPNMDLSIITQILNYAVYLSNNCVLTKFQKLAKNPLFDLICVLIQKYKNLKDYFINLLLDVFDDYQKNHIEFLISCIKDPMSEDKDFLDPLEDTENSGFLSKKVSLELGYNTDFLKFETKLRILEVVYESSYHFVDFERKKRIRKGLTFFDSRFADEPFINSTLEACLPDSHIKEKYWDVLKYNETKMPRNQLVAIMRGFARKGQHSIMNKYFHTKLFEEFILIKNFNGSQYTTLLFKYLNPSFLIDDDILEKMNWLNENRVSKNEYVLKKEITKSISELKINLKVAHIFRQNHQKLFSELNKLEKK